MPLSVKIVHFILLVLLLVVAVITKTGYVNNDDDDELREGGKSSSFFGGNGATKNSPACTSAFCSTKSRKYILYDVNKGEGFNLRRDIYVRIAPIVKSLNEEGNHSQWILVLPPWGQLPHWTDSHNFYAWKTFFNVGEIQKYIPAIDFEEFLDEYGLDNPIDVLYQLEHFPLDSLPSRNVWSENVRVCDSPMKWQRDSTSGLFTGKFWNNKLLAKNASCLALKGQSSDIVNFFLESLPKSVLLSQAEVILWDDYGGDVWWAARSSLKFADNLIEIAIKWVQKKYPSFIYLDMRTANYLAVHIRRGDFVLYRNDQPSLFEIANQIVKIVSKLHISHVFVATDGTEQDIDTIQRHVSTTENVINFDRFDCKEHKLLEGQCAIVDQIISSWSKYFIGSPESTFTFRIFEEREILSIDPEFNYHLFCAGGKVDCPKSTRWPIIKGAV